MDREYILGFHMVSKAIEVSHGNMIQSIERVDLTTYPIRSIIEPHHQETPEHC
jgi:hypothetical protein